MAKHPTGLYMLSSIEMWERFSYYGMRAILSLYMVYSLMFTLPFATTVYGTYTAFIYLTPLLGGYVSDRYLGNRKSIAFGSVLMAIGQFTLAYSAFLYNPLVNIAPHSSLIFTTQEIVFVIGLFILCIGCGFIKANISSMINFLYKKNDTRLDAAYNIFYVGINLGAFISPLIIGVFVSSQHPEWYPYGFLIAGIGMCIGLAILLIFKDKYLVDYKGRQIGKLPSSKEELNSDEEELNEAILKKVGNEESIVKKTKEKLKTLTVNEKKEFLNSPLTKVEKQRIYAIILISFISVFFWSAFEQAGVSLTFFTNTFISRRLFNFTVPTEWFQSVNSFFIIILAPLFAIMWTKLNEKKKNLSVGTKMSISLFVLAIGFVIFAIPAGAISLGAASVGMHWIIILYFILTIAELFISPIGLSTIAKLSPTKFTSLFLGIWFGSTALANFIAGILSRLYPDPSLPTPYLLGIIPINGFFEFFILFAIFASIGGVIVLLLKNKINKWANGAI